MSAHVDFQQQYADITQSSKTDIPALSQGPSNEVKQYQKKSYESFDKCYIYAQSIAAVQLPNLGKFLLNGYSQYGRPQRKPKVRSFSRQ